MISESNSRLNTKLFDCSWHGFFFDDYFDFKRVMVKVYFVQLQKKLMYYYF